MGQFHLDYTFTLEAQKLNRKQRMITMEDKINYIIDNLKTKMKEVNKQKIIDGKLCAPFLLL